MQTATVPHPSQRPPRLPPRLGPTSPCQVAALVLVLYSTVWLAHLIQTSLSPPTDNIEQLNWMHSLEWGYYKHPPLPTWIIWATAQLFGANAGSSYALAIVVNLATMVVIWRLLKQLRGPHVATVLLMLVLCISYYNGGLTSYNHNTVLTLFSTASAALTWKAFATARLRWYAALGFVLGLGALTKYQIAVTALCALVFWLSQKGWRQTQQRRGMWLTVLIVMAMLVPHIEWLRSHDFASIHYAIDSSLGAQLGFADRSVETLLWLVDQLLNRCLGAWMMLAIAFLISPSRPVQTHASMHEPFNDTVIQRASRALILSWGLVPLIFMPLLGMLTGSALPMRWGAPFILFAVPTVMELLATKLSLAKVQLAHAAFAFATVQLLWLVASYVTSVHGPSALRDQHWRSFDSAALVRQIATQWGADFPISSICIVSGPTALAGAVALQLPGHPLVLIDGRYDRSPWVNPVRTDDCSTLVLQQGEPLAGGKPLGPTFPNLWWRVTRRN